jgi:ferrous iron transport protein B
MTPTPTLFEKTSDHQTRLTMALAGNPNAGKTTVFNAITGARQKVGNYAGVTVEKKEGFTQVGQTQLDILDLPGTYSLTAYSAEEIVARNVLMDGDPDVVIDVVDSSNLERNLYLAVQLLELGVPLVLAFNMSDIARSRGYHIDIEALSTLLGVPIVETVGNKQQGIDDLLATAIDTAKQGQAAIDTHRPCNYGAELEPHIEELTELAQADGLGERHARWFALKLIEHDKEAIKRIHEWCPSGADELQERAEQIRQHIETIYGDQPEIILADRRYGYISGACTESVRNTVESRHDVSDKIDTVMTNQTFGLLIFFALMFLVFHLTFAIGNPMKDGIEAGKDALVSWLSGAWSPEAMPLLRSLALEGILEGVGTVLTFLPIILMLFLAISFLEDTGYMARAAFIVDHHMHKLGLHGKSFIPMLIGFGCSVPAILATRTLESRRDRLTTMLIVPLMSCAARLAIYIMIVPTFLSDKWQAPAFFIIYLFGILVAVACAKLLRMTVLKGDSMPFVMELPPYRMPTLKGLTIHMWERSYQYVKKAGTVILLATIILWAANTFPRDHAAIEHHDAQMADYDVQLASAPTPEAQVQLQEQASQLQNQFRAYQVENSAMGRLGHWMEPALRPMGFDWKIGTSFLGALPAKEIFVSQMRVIYALGEEGSDHSLTEQIRSNYSPLVAICIIVFALISAPCVATTAATWSEAGWKWAIFQFIGLTVLAYTLTTITYQVGRLILLATG